MDALSLSELVKTPFYVEYLNALKQFWREDKTFSCVGQPKKQCIMLYLKGCKAKYTTANGEVIYAEDGDVVYAPQGSEYEVVFYDFEEGGYTVGINFRLYAYGGERLFLGESVALLTKKSYILREYFDRADALSGDGSTLPIENRILFLTIIELASRGGEREGLYIIAEGKKYLDANYAENPTTAYLANLCGVSEVYFRRLFKKSEGMTVTEYRTRLKVEKAAAILEYGEMSVGEISETLGYATVAHFIKQFKKAYGITPLGFRISRTKSAKG